MSLTVAGCVFTLDREWFDAWGGWASAAATAVAVFIAATMAERSAARSERARHRRQFDVLTAIYREVDLLLTELVEDATPGPEGVGVGPPDAERFEHLALVLDAVNVLDLEGYPAVADLFAVRRAVADAKRLSDEWKAASGWSPIHARLFKMRQKHVAAAIEFAEQEAGVRYANPRGLHWLLSRSRRQPCRSVC